MISLVVWMLPEDGRRYCMIMQNTAVTTKVQWWIIQKLG